MEILGRTYYETPLGLVELEATARGMFSLRFVLEPVAREIAPDNEHLLAGMEQLDEYFGGKRLLFNIMFDLAGTEFQQRVWRALTEIPFAQTRTYSDIARHIGHPDSFRAVGASCARNRLGILVPCHRVLGVAGDLTGYAGGINRKQWLLEHERGVIFGKQTLLFG